MTPPDDQQPVMLPFRDKDGPGWHVIIRYHAGHERRIDGFSSEEDALNWIVANAGQVEKQSRLPADLALSPRHGLTDTVVVLRPDERRQQRE